MAWTRRTAVLLLLFGQSFPANICAMKKAAIFALLCAFTNANAQQEDSWVEITPFGGYRMGGSFEVEESSDSFDIEDSSSFGLILNFPHRAETRWEILYSQQSTEAEFSGAVAPNDALIDLDLHVLQIGGTYQFESDAVVPYLAATLGATHIEATGSNDSESDTFWSGSIGLGFLIKPNSKVGVRLEARAHGTFTNSSTDLFCQTDPAAGGICAIRVKGDVVTQIEVFAGVVFRF